MQSMLSAFIAEFFHFQLILEFFLVPSRKIINVFTLFAFHFYQIFSCHTDSPLQIPFSLSREKVAPTDSRRRMREIFDLIIYLSPRADSNCWPTPYHGVALANWATWAKGAGPTESPDSLRRNFSEASVLVGTPTLRRGYNGPPYFLTLLVSHNQKSKLDSIDSWNYII